MRGLRLLSLGTESHPARDCVAHPWRESWTPGNRAVEADIMRQNLADEQALATMQ